MTIYGLLTLCLFAIIFGWIGLKLSVSNIVSNKNNENQLHKGEQKRCQENFVEKIEKFKF